MKRKANRKTAAKKRAVPKPRNPIARALKENALFKPKVVPAAKSDVYRRRAKHRKIVLPDDETED
jgi:hypothetical protein